MRPLSLRAAVLVLVASCAPAAPAAATPTPSRTAAEATPTPTSVATFAPGLAATVRSLRTHYALPDALYREPAQVEADFAVDPRPGMPLARIDQGSDVPMVMTGGGAHGFRALATIDLAGIRPGSHRVDVLVRLPGGKEGFVGVTELNVAPPRYAVWTLDFEGDAAGDAEMTNTAAIADAFGVPMTIMWNPRVWTTAQVGAARAEAMLAWTKARIAKGDEVALHIHAWTDFVRAAGVVPRTAPNWALRGDGYDVPLTAFDEGETRKLVEFALALMAEHGLPRPTSFRAGGLFANAANLRAVAAAGFTADCSATPAGSFGYLRLPWTLGPTAQPYFPSRDDANIPGDLPLLEAPTIGGNTYGLNSSSIVPIALADIRMFEGPSARNDERVTFTIVSHPGTIDASERAAIETLLKSLESTRYDRDAGTLRFVTLAQLAKAYAR